MTSSGLLQTAVSVWKSRQTWEVICLVVIAYFAGGAIATIAGSSWFYPIGFVVGTICSTYISERDPLKGDREVKA